MTSPVAHIPVDTILGNATTLAEYKGKVLLVVNVASKCGLTPQYEALEKLYQRFKDQGFVVLGFPANDFAGQEPGTNEEIQQFCSTNFDVTFPMFAKIPVTGPEKHPFYDALIQALPFKQDETESFRQKLRDHGIAPNDDPEVLWNFEKFLINREGHVVGRYAPATPPDAPGLVAAIEAELAK
ncbi:MAG: glutathione peroxidase [Sphingobium sp.]